MNFLKNIYENSVYLYKKYLNNIFFINNYLIYPYFIYLNFIYSGTLVEETSSLNINNLFYMVTVNKYIYLKYIFNIFILYNIQFIS